MVLSIVKEPAPGIGNIDMNPIDEISHAIGSLEAKIEGMNVNFEHMIKYIKETNERTESRLNSLEGFKYKVYGMASICSVILTSAVNIGIGWFKTKNG